MQNPGNNVPNDSSQIDDLDLLLHAKEQETGNRIALNEILAKHRARLRKMVALRMNDRLQGRLDASDVIQETFVEASRALDDYLKDPKFSVYLWLRRLAGQKLIQAHRKHVDAQKRTVGRELSIHGGVPAANSECMAIELSGNVETPSRIAQRNEASDQLTKALELMDELDREVLSLRHFEQLTSKESAEVLGMSNEAVKKRYVRALDKLQKILSR